MAKSAENPDIVIKLYKKKTKKLQLQTHNNMQQSIFMHKNLKSILVILVYDYFCVC